MAASCELFLRIFRKKLVAVKRPKWNNESLSSYSQVLAVILFFACILHLLRSGQPRRVWALSGRNHFGINNTRIAGCCHVENL